MVAYFEKVQLLAREEVVAAPAAEAWQDYGFELPPALYAAMAALFLGFVGVLSLAFANPGMGRYPSASQSPSSPLSSQSR